MRFLVYIFIALITAGGLSYVHTSDPEALDDLLVHIDVLGITPAAQQEQERQAQIRALDIPYEKKKVLMERTVFMGASRQMVFLALGEPKTARYVKGKQAHANGKNVTEQWIFFFKGDARPTVLEFEKETLVSAYKGSNIDLNGEEPAAPAAQ